MDDRPDIRYLRSIRNILSLIMVVVVFVILNQLSSLILPLVFAGLFTILALPLINGLSRLRVPRFLITLLVAVVSVGILWLVLVMIRGTVEQMFAQRAVLGRQFAQKINALLLWLGSILPGVDADVLIEHTDALFSPAKISALIGTAFGTLTNFGSSFVLFVLYYILLLAGATGYSAYIDYVAGTEKDGGAREVWHLTQESISAYMGIKTIISLVTGLITGLICWIFGLQFALFWGFLAFLLNYIPSIGSILSTVLPLLMAIIQFDGVGLTLGLAVLLGASQFLIGSVIDPMIMGNRLRLNTVTVIFGLLFWGYIWGIPGMLLSVPLMVMIRLILERSEDLSIFARIMGNSAKTPRSGPALYTRILQRGKKNKSSVSESDDS